jgi:ParB family chromosome partitioning protein
MAAALNISSLKVSRLLKLALLPNAIVNAFSNALDIRESWGVKLTEVLEDPVRRQPALRAARAIATEPERLRPPDEVYRKILAAAAPTAPGGRKIISGLHDQVIEGEDGTPLFRVRHQQDSIALLLPLDKTSAKTLDAIQHAVARILTTSTTEVIPSVREREFSKLQGAIA